MVSFIMHTNVYGIFNRRLYNGKTSRFYEGNEKKYRKRKKKQTITITRYLSWAMLGCTKHIYHFHHTKLHIRFCLFCLQWNERRPLSAQLVSLLDEITHHSTSECVLLLNTIPYSVRIVLFILFIKRTKRLSVSFSEAHTTISKDSITHNE